MSVSPNYDAVGGTRPAERVWAEHPDGYRRYERTIRLTQTSERWDDLAADLLAWSVKTQSGFTVERLGQRDVRVQEGGEYRLIARVGPLKVTEPVRVIAVVNMPDRCGFAYGTLPGHPVAGEEAFVLHRDSAGHLSLTLRSLTRAAPSGRWRLLFPVLLVAQRWYRSRYLRAFTPAR